MLPLLPPFFGSTGFGIFGAFGTGALGGTGGAGTVPGEGGEAGAGIKLPPSVDRWAEQSRPPQIGVVEHDPPIFR